MLTPDVCTIGTLMLTFVQAHIEMGVIASVVILKARPKRKCFPLGFACPAAVSIIRDQAR